MITLQGKQSRPPTTNVYTQASQRHIIIHNTQVEDGVVRKLNVEAGGPFGVSSAETMLQQLGELA
jgi:peroxiredoxin